MSATGLQAQRIVVTIQDTLVQRGVAGALVTVSERASGVAVYGMTNDAGRVSLKLPSFGLWTASVRRIGIMPAAVAAVRVDSAQTATVVILVRNARFTLPQVRVTARAAVCGRAPTGSDRTAALWEQVTLALRAATITRTDSAGGAPLHVAMFERQLARNGTKLSERPLKSGTGTGRPFFAADPDSLARFGYVRSERGGTLAYFAPDETVLLSDAFVRTHCFESPATDGDPQLAELTFRPVPRRGVPDVKGTAFVDATSGELRRIEFRFVNVDRLFAGLRIDAGGDVNLRRLDSGQWVVSEWAIRMPTFLRVAWGPADAHTGYREVGGVLSTEPLMPQSESRPAVDPTFGRDDGVTARMVELRSGFDLRRQFGVGQFRDSAALAAVGAVSAIDLLRVADSSITYFTVPDGIEAPPVSQGITLARAWRPGARLPMMPIADADSSGISLCLIMLYLDSLPTTVREIERLPAANVAALEFYPHRKGLPDAFVQPRNRCGTAVLWSYSDPRSVR